MKHNVWLYIGVMGLVSFLVRVLPMTLFRKPIKSRFVRSFLYYVPYVTLAVMTFPAILYATGSVYAGAAALAVGIVAAYFGFDLFKTAVSCCAVVLILELLL